MSKKVILAYSGGEKQSVIANWLQCNYGYEIITFTADLGQEKKKIELAYKKAKVLGIKKMYIEDLKESFVTKYICHRFRANTIYECGKKIGASIVRPLIIKRLIEIAKLNKTTNISYGTTKKSKDLIRLDLSTYSLNPYIKIIAPWRALNFLSQNKLRTYFKKKKFSNEFVQKHKISCSVNNDFLHIYSKCGCLDNTWNEAKKKRCILSNFFKNTPDKQTYIDITFKQGNPTSINSEVLKTHEIMIKLNNLGSKHGIGRVNKIRYYGSGLKARCCYENPGVTILYHAHRAIESFTLDHEILQIKDILMPLYAEKVYTVNLWTKEIKMLKALIDTSQKYVNGIVRIKLYKGNVVIIGIKSDQ